MKVSGVLCLTVLIALSCGGSENKDASNASLSNTDPHQIIQRALKSMNDAESYQVQVAAAGNRPGTSEFVAPHDYHQITRLPGLVSEVIVVADSGYWRSCKDEEVQCSAWRKEPRDSGTFDATFPSFNWPLVAVELATDLTLAGSPADGEGIHVRGVVDPTIAIDEAQRRARPSPPPSNNQRYTSTIEVVISPNDFLIHRITLTDDPSSTKPDWLVEYSRFNDVTIKPPQ